MLGAGENGVRQTDVPSRYGTSGDDDEKGDFHNQQGGDERTFEEGATPAPAWGGTGG